ncbi:uncharacterized protein [Asterias amurensis]|uniref:uncharacterized protein n=1 Tax=Asterias amurensis TaxID=7602 RepID=UPI003AB5081F
MGTCTASAMGLLSLSLLVFLQLSFTAGVCVNESIPPIVPPTTWTAWFSVDDPTDGTENETLAAVRSAYPSVCVTPTQAECRVRFLHTDYVTARQSLVLSCTPAAGLLCQNSDQPHPQETCLDYEIRLECPTPAGTLPDPQIHWELSGKANESDDDPTSCGGPITSIYPSKGGLIGTVNEPKPISADSFNSSNHLCAHRTNGTYDNLSFEPSPNKCITDTPCCTSGWTLTFWMRYRSTASSLRRYIISTGGHETSTRGFTIYLTRKLSLIVNGDLNLKAWGMKIDSPDLFPTDVWTHHCFTYNADDGTRYYKNGVLGFSLTTATRTETSPLKNYDNVHVFTSNGNNAGRPEGDFSDFKMFYRTFNETEVLTAFLKETTESKLVIHYLVQKNTDDAFDVELVCLAKSGSHPNITWHRSDDEAHFYVVYPSSNVDIVESFPNIYRTRSELKFRSMKPASDVIIACEASDVVGSKGSTSKSITIPKVDVVKEVVTQNCYLGQEPDSNQEGKLRWVLPVDYNNRCICTRLLPGGLNLYTPERSYIPYYIDQPPFRATEREMVTFLDCPVDFSIIGKPTEQSSTNSAGHASHKAVDGKGLASTQNGDCTKTKDGGEMDPWWRVDLEGDHCIRTITIINRIDCCSERLTGAVVRAGIDPIVTNNTICGEPVTTEQAAPRGGIIEFKCDPPVRAHYVFVDIPRDTPAILQLCEVMVKEFPLEIC